MEYQRDPGPPSVDAFFALFCLDCVDNWIWGKMPPTNKERYRYIGYIYENEMTT